MKLTYTFYSDWAIGSGKGGNGYDSIILLDDDKLPFIPGKTIKGLLREAFLEYGYTTDEAITLFGQEKSEDTEAKALQAGLLQFNSAYLSDALKQLPEEVKKMLFRSRTSTRLDENKQAVNHSLRKNQVSIPLVLESTILMKEDNSELNETNYKKIENAAKMLKMLGEKRHRGLGRVKVTAAKYTLQTATQKASNKITINGKTIRFKCEVTEPLILVKKDKTGQNTDALEYLPGNTFRGIVAGQIAGDDESEFDDIILNGTVRFGDAHLIIDSKRSYKAPFSFYYDKNSNDNKIYNFHLLDDNDWDNKKLKLQKQGFIILKDGQLVLQKIDYASRMKSSRNHKTRSSDEGGLFLYHYIKKGQSFEFEVNSENTNYLKNIIEILDGKTKYFGKSKTAEFGGAIKITYEGEKEINTPITEGNYLYAESNLCFLNEYGEFTTTPTPEQLGVSSTNAAIDWEKSQIKFRTFAPYNFHRKNWDFERLIIEKGSVFVFTKEVNFDADKLQKGIGCFLTEGYGRVLVNPEFLNDKKITLQADNTTEQSNNEISVTVDENDEEIIKLVKKRYIRYLDEVKINHLVTENSKGWRQKKPSQWARVFNATSKAKNLKELKEELFTKTDNNRNKSIFNGGSKRWDEQDKNKMEGFLEKEVIKDYPVLSVRKLAKKMISQNKND